MLELLVRYFGTATAPDYGRTPELLARDPYRRVREQLQALCARVLDLTDLNYDLAAVYALEQRSGLPTVRLSLVGPYAVVLGPKGDLHDDKDVAALLAGEGFQVLRDRELLEQPVHYWGPEFIGPLYEFLFEFDQGLPWRR